MLLPGTKAKDDDKKVRMEGEGGRAEGGMRSCLQSSCAVQIRSEKIACTDNLIYPYEKDCTENLIRP